MIVLSPLIYGMYPSMVRDHIEKRELNLKDSLRFSYHKFWSLLGANLLAYLVMVAVILVITIPSTLLCRIIAMIVVAAVPAVFFCYIEPAIIMDNMKAMAGFRKSIEVAKKNYLFTLPIVLIPTAIEYAVYGIFIGVQMYMGDAIYISILSLAIGSIITLFVTTWEAIMMP
jgi:hypothetical protein